MMFWILSCLTPDPLEEWSREPNTLQTQCENERVPELQMTCWIQLAALEGSSGKEANGIKACAQLQEHSTTVSREVLNTWQSECAFRLGEELAAGGDLIAGLRHCAFSGPFTQNCITHSIWRRSIDLTVNSDTKSSHIWKRAEEQLTLSMTQLLPLSTLLQQDASNQLVGRYGYAIYMGSGIANPEPAHLTDRWGPSFRTGYAVERIRLATQSKNRWTETEIDTLFDQIIDDWQKNRSISGLSDEQALQKGRTSVSRLSPYEETMPKANLFGGGRRLVHTDPKTDLTISLIEALFWYPHTPVNWFSKWMTHPEIEIRLTAAKLFCLSNGLRGEASKKVKYSLGEDPQVDWHLETCPLR